MDVYLPPRPRQERIFRDRPDLLEELTEREIVGKYRLSYRQIYEIHDLIEDEVRPRTSRSHALSAMTKVVAAIDSRLRNIEFPTTPDAMAQIKKKMYDIAGVPNCLGAIDGTHIAIMAPRQEEALYVCRKGFHSINVQATVDTNMRFTDVVAQWPGSTHDSVMFDNCGLKQWLQTTNNGWLIGDSGYPLRSYLMTPKINPTSRQEIMYNAAISKTRVVIERTFGVLKSRFRCLHKTGGFLQVTPQKAAKLFVVCAKLHNLCIRDGLTIDCDVEVDDDAGREHAEQHADGNAVQLRNNLIATF